MRKTDDQAFKLKISKQIVNKEITVTQVAMEHQISRPIVSRWVSELYRYKNQAFSGQGNRCPEQAQRYALEAEVKHLKEGNEILKSSRCLWSKKRNKVSICPQTSV